MTKDEMRSSFEEIYGQGDGIRFFFAPGRVNLIGEHTDYNGGHVFPCALTLGMYAAARLRDDQTVRMTSLNLKKAEVFEFSLSEGFQNGDRQSWTAYPIGVFWAMAENGKTFERGIDLLFYGDIPSGSGLSSSAALELATAAALRALYGFDDLDNQELAFIGQKAEREYVGMNCGIMDQFASAMGKKDSAIFLATERIRYEYVPLKMGSTRIVVTNSRVHHELASSEYNTRREECEKALKKLKVVANVATLGDMSMDQFESCKDVIMNDVLIKRARHAVYENARTIQAVSALRADNLERFGALMNQSHVSLRDDYEVSCPEIDFLTSKAWEIPGVIGSRITGGGFGGCTVSIIEESAIPEYERIITEAYEKEYGLTPLFYVVSPGEGVHEIV